jgi:uncharacterized repeat protein (TIGR03803 family)
MRSILSVMLLIGFATTAFAQTATEQTLYNFSGGSDGAVLSCCDRGSLIVASDGNLYGTTFSDGTYGFGTVFRISSDGSFSSVYSFTGINDGAQPQAGLIQGGNGNLYGTATVGGYNADGTVFQVSTLGNFSTVYAFRDGSDGGQPSGPVTQGSDGNFYGYTEYGAYDGTLFHISLTGAFTTLVALNGSERAPDGSLVQGTDGNFYALTYNSIYRFGSTGSLDVLGTLSSCDAGGGLIEGADGDYYGSYCADNGADFYDVFFKVDASGTLITLYSSAPAPGSSSESFLVPALLLGSDGNFYGVTPAGGTNGFGSLFRLTPSGTYSTLYSFTYKSDGETPTGSLVQGSDGSFYGVAQGGADGDGLIYKISLSPALPAPVALSFNVSSVNAYTPVTLSWVVPNGTSKTMQQCYASVQGNPSGAGTWSGLQTGAFSDGVYFGSSSITPTVAGTYIYALTCGGVESGFATLTVNAADRTGTKTTLTASPNPATVGAYVTLTGTVKETTGSGTPTGKLTFYYGTSKLTTVNLNGSGVGSFVASSAGLPPGKYSLTAAYSGDANNDPSTSAAVVVTLNAAPDTTAVLTAAPQNVSQNSSTTLSAAVSSSAGTPTGEVKFYYGSQALGSATLNGNGVAAMTAQANVPKGSYPITAVYMGDAQHSSATSQPLTITVQ